MKLKMLLMVLFLLPLSFAAWQSLAAVALVASFALLALLFMIGKGFGINELQMMAKEEIYQVIAVGLLVVILLGADGLLNAISVDPTFKGEEATMQNAALLSISNTQDQLSSYFNGVIALDNKVAQESAKGFNCNIMQVGYSISGCGGFSMLSPPLSMAGSILGFAIGELAAIAKLIEISSTYSLALLLPAGILLRTFKVTRGAGGLLIALGISMHILLPMGILFMDILGNNFLSYGDTDYSVAGIPPDIDDPYHDAPTVSLTDFECDPSDSGSSFSDIIGWFTNPIGGIEELIQGNNEDKAVAVYLAMRASMKAYLYVALIKATLGPAISLLMFISGLRAMTSLAGAEVDVSALAKVA